MTLNAYIHVRDVTTPGICNASGTYFMCIALLKTLRVLLHFFLFFCISDLVHTPGKVCRLPESDEVHLK